MHPVAHIVPSYLPACLPRYLRAQGLSAMPQLRILDVSSNALTTVEGLESLTCLEDLWLNENKIPLEALQGGALEAGLAPVKDCLTCIYLERTPRGGGGGPGLPGAAEGLSGCMGRMGDTCTLRRADVGLWPRQRAGRFTGRVMNDSCMRCVGMREWGRAPLAAGAAHGWAACSRGVWVLDPAAEHIWCSVVPPAHCFAAAGQ